MLYILHVTCLTAGQIRVNDELWNLINLNRLELNNSNYVSVVSLQLCFADLDAMTVIDIWSEFNTDLSTQYEDSSSNDLSKFVGWLTVIIQSSDR